jgi:antitoxin component YwqK of YwqJK toxin-antitoxin module
MQTNAKAMEVPLPEHTVEREKVSKPTNGIGKQTEIMRGNTIIGERVYYPDGQLLIETFLDEKAPLPPGLQVDQFSSFPALPITIGLPDGLQRQWYTNGQLWKERPYNRGILNGTCRNWDFNGHPLASDEFRNGTGVLHSFYPDGRLSDECPYVMGRRHGVEREWYPSGELNADAAYEAGEQEGWARAYYREGTLRQEAFYLRGEIHGILREWDEQGHYTDNTPRYFVEGKEVPADEFTRRAKGDRDLTRSLDSLSAKGDLR